MSILIGVGIVTTVTTLYLSRKGWQALHKAVGITPGALTYQDYDAPLSLSTLLLSKIHWQQLKFNKEHLKGLSEQQLRQLKGIDEKVNRYQDYQKSLQTQGKIPAVTEQQFVLHKMLYTRLPEMLTSHYHLAKVNISANSVRNDKKTEASELLESVLNNIEQRLDNLLEQMDTQYLQELRVMKNYLNSHDS